MRPSRLIAVLIIFISHIGYSADQTMLINVVRPGATDEDHEFDDMVNRLIVFNKFIDDQGVKLPMSPNAQKNTKIEFTKEMSNDLPFYARVRFYKEKCITYSMSLQKVDDGYVYVETTYDGEMPKIDEPSQMLLWLLGNQERNITKVQSLRLSKDGEVLSMRTANNKGMLVGLQLKFLPGGEIDRKVHDKPQSGFRQR